MTFGWSQASTPVGDLEATDMIRSGFALFFLQGLTGPCAHRSWGPGPGPGPWPRDQNIKPTSALELNPWSDQLAQTDPSHKGITTEAS